MTGPRYESEQASSPYDPNRAAVQPPAPAPPPQRSQPPGAIYDTGLASQPLPPSPGSIYDTGLSSTPLPPPPGSVYDTGLSSMPLPPMPPMPMPSYPSNGSGNLQAEVFVHAVRTEIRQLESYFKRQTNRFRLLGAGTLVMAAAVPVAIAAGAWSWLAAALGALAAITGSLQTLFGFQDSAGNAMSLAGRLESELVRYETGTTPYSLPPSMCFNQFVDRVTSLREDGTASFSGVWRAVQAPSSRA